MIINKKYQTSYISELPKEKINEIASELVKAVEYTELVERALDGRVCDLEDTIEIKYITLKSDYDILIGNLISIIWDMSNNDTEETERLLKEAGFTESQLEEYKEFYEV